MDWASQVALVVKNLPANVGDIRDTGSISGWEDPLEEDMAIHSIIVAWRISRTEEPGGLHSMGSQSQTWLKWLSTQHINMAIDWGCDKSIKEN